MAQLIAIKNKDKFIARLIAFARYSSADFKCYEVSEHAESFNLNEEEKEQIKAAFNYIIFTGIGSKYKPTIIYKYIKNNKNKKLKKFEKNVNNDKRCYKKY